MTGVRGPAPDPDPKAPAFPAHDESAAPCAAPTADLDPGAAALPARLAPLAETARDYARAAASQNTNRAYAVDWRPYSAWARRQNLPALPPDPQVLGLDIAACASGAIGGKACSAHTIERRLPALAWNLSQRGQPMDRKDRHVATVLAGFRRTQGRPPEQKEAVLPEDLLAMIATLDLGDLRGLRDRAILLVGFAGDLRRSEILGLDCRAEDGLSGGRIEVFDDGALLTRRGKTGWREVEIGRGFSDATCAVVARLPSLRFDGADSRLDRPRRRVAVAHDTAPAVGQTKLGMFRQKRLELRLDRLRDQAARARAQNPGQWIDDFLRLAKRDDSRPFHGVLLLREVRGA